MTSRRPTTAVVTQYAKTRCTRQKLEAEVERLKDQEAQLKPKVLEYFTKAGVDRQTVSTPAGSFTVSPRYELWAGRDPSASREDLHLWLEEAGLEEYATEGVNTQGLSAHVREVYRELENEWPLHIITVDRLLGEIFSRYPQLAGKLKITEKYELSLNKAAASSARRKMAALPKEVLEDEIR
jgi:hypothetical protein